MSFDKRGLAALLAVLAVAVSAQAPSNNNVGSPISIQDGVNPLPPSGSSAATYTNVNATNSVLGAHPGCVAFNKDVWFSYVPPRTGEVTMSTCTPSGFAAETLVDTSLAVYDSTATVMLACNDDSSTCGPTSLKSFLQFNAYYGMTYLVRVGSISSVAAGTFYLNVVDPFQTLDDFCSFASTIAVGVGGPYSMAGTAGGGAAGCAGFNGVTDRWFKFTSPASPAASEAQFKFTGVADIAAAYVGGCGGSSPIGCATSFIGTTYLQFPVAPSTTYHVRVGMTPALSPASYAFSVEFLLLESPPNDHCAAAHRVTNGIYPTGLSDAPSFRNVGATTTSGIATCSLNHGDVFFRYVATDTGKITVSTHTPFGRSPGTLTDTVVSVYSACGGVRLACNDNSLGGLLSLAEFDAIQGQTYRIAVSSFGEVSVSEGAFHLTIDARFRMTLSSPAAGAFRLRLDDGGPSHVALSILTVHSGAYPNGPFFGIEPTLTELTIQIAYGSAPFLALMDGSGAYQFDYAGLPPFAVYGAGLQFDEIGQIAGVTPPVHALIN